MKATTLSKETRKATVKSGWGSGRTSWGSGEIKRHLAYLVMLLPGIIFLFVFSYLPLPTIVMAFKKYQLAIPPADHWLQNKFLYALFYKSPWVGFENFKFILDAPQFPIFMRNTIGYNLVFMAVGLIAAVGIAVGINELRQRKLAKLYHTILFLPYFLSWIIVTYILFAFISPAGVIPQVFKALGLEPPQLYNTAGAWPFIYVIFNLWKYAGNGSIIYLSTITGFSQELYEAAAIDGAGKWKQFIYVTLPQLVPTIILLQILAVGRILNADFDMFYNLRNGASAAYQNSLTIDVYVYEMIASNPSKLYYPAAAAFFQSLIGFVLVLTTNAIVRKVEPEMAMF
ncbi:MAG: ABC transporter permease [Caldicoprobacterales bacterium]|jgi:putative aldouronate transport system permease protein